jgi:hypothetical protein
MRDTFASNALAARVTVFELAKIRRTSVRMIEPHLHRRPKRPGTPSQADAPSPR